MTNRDLLILAGDVSERLERHGLVACGRRENGVARVDFWTGSDGRGYRLELKDEAATLEDVVATCLSIAGVQRAPDAQLASVLTAAEARPPEHEDVERVQQVVGRVDARAPGVGIAPGFERQRDVEGGVRARVGIAGGGAGAGLRGAELASVEPGAVGGADIDVDVVTEALPDHLLTAGRARERRVVVLARRGAPSHDVERRGGGRCILHRTQNGVGDEEAVMRGTSSDDEALGVADR